MKKIKLHRVSYSPGYCDMMGGGHEVSLEKGGDGNWNYICRDREDHSAPQVTTVYAVSEEAADRFADFIQKKRVISLKNRPKSDIFATDYSPWRWNIDYETTLFGKKKTVYCGFGEYKVYSGRDRRLLKELSERFRALRGEKISETVEEDEQ